MVKRSIFTLLFLAVMGWASAQSLQFEYDGHVYANDETVFCFNYLEDFGEFIQDMQIRNLTGNNMDVVLEREEISVSEGSSNYFCWGLCFSPGVSISQPVTVAAGELTGEGMLAFHYLPMETTTSTSIRYYAYDPRVDGTRISIVIVFNSGENVGEKAFADMGHAYPNPASSDVHFNYEVSAGSQVSVSVYNLLGQEVKSQKVNGLQGRVSISVLDLKEGIYFCKLFVNDCAVKTEKFVVKK